MYKGGNDVTVKKTRNLNKCAHREGINLPFLSTGYYTKSVRLFILTKKKIYLTITPLLIIILQELQSTPLFVTASLNVEQKIASGIVKSAVAQELYESRPIQGAQTGAQVVVVTKLTLESQGKMQPVAGNNILSICI